MEGMITVLRRMFRLGIVIGSGAAAWAAWTAWQRRRTAVADPAPEWKVVPAPDPAPGPGPAATSWSDPVDGGCPDGFPVKAKTTSGIYHVPGGRFYDRTVPDRCYPDPAAAEADGYRAAKS